MENYKAIFKCRLCGEEFIACETRDRGLAINSATCASMGIIGKVTSSNAPALHDIHICDNGDIGISDFLGFRVEEE